MCLPHLSHLWIGQLRLCLDVEVRPGQEQWGLGWFFHM